MGGFVLKKILSSIYPMENIKPKQIYDLAGQMLKKKNLATFRGVYSYCYRSWQLPVDLLQFSGDTLWSNIFCYFSIGAMYWFSDKIVLSMTVQRKPVEKIIEL